MFTRLLVLAGCLTAWFMQKLKIYEAFVVIDHLNSSKQRLHTAQFLQNLPIYLPYYLLNYLLNHLPDYLLNYMPDYLLDYLLNYLPYYLLGYLLNYLPDYLLECLPVFSLPEVPD